MTNETGPTQIPSTYPILDITKQNLIFIPQGASENNYNEAVLTN